MGSWEDIKDGIMQSITDEASGFIVKHGAARLIIEDRAKRLARLTEAYVKATPTQRPLIEQDMGIVRLSLENELSAIALDASAEAKAAFVRTANVVFTTLIRTLPKIVGL